MSSFKIALTMETARSVFKRQVRQLFRRSDEIASKLQKLPSLFYYPDGIIWGDSSDKKNAGTFDLALVMRVLTLPVVSYVVVSYTPWRYFGN